MRILMISEVYFPRGNGVSTSIQTFARELESAGHWGTLIARDDAVRGGGGSADPFEVMRIPSRYLPIDPEDRIMRVRRLRRHYPERRAAASA